MASNIISPQNQEASASHNVAVIFGVTGMVGREIAKKLISNPDWKVYGVARRPDRVPLRFSSTAADDYQFIPCDLLNPVETRAKLSAIPNATHLFWVTWASQHPQRTKQCCDQNRAMLSNALEPILLRSNSLKHVSLQTGLKHYRTAKGGDLRRLVVGNSSKSIYNVIGGLAVYGTICRRLDLPFVFGGTRECWEEEYIDGSDARLAADQHIWAATDERVRSTTGGQALNSVNGSGFAWREVWLVIGEKMGVAVPEEALAPEEFRYAAAMGGMEGVWDGIVAEEGLVATEIGELASWEFLDHLFRMPVKLLGSREKSDRLGFTARREMAESVSFWIDTMREDKLIP
ncbi:unnamed protein product [Linum tenue]|uniref:NAD-dependent epimerase/dehydratase domain-containing protein n=1 Tax=Linum tenue TaxID=586396 RepID=A0AAV0N4W7_9ROSI|nr:unnamed protein product [Linum tenue]